MGLDQALLTLLQVMTGDSWASMVARPVLKVQPQMWVFFVLFVAVAMMVLLNLITAVIVDNALEISKEDHEMKLRALKDAEAAARLALTKLFVELDEDGSGLLDRDEYNAAIRDPKLVDQFLVLGFSESDLPGLFDMIDMDMDGQITVDEFSDGIGKLQGEAKSADLMGCERRLFQKMLKIQEYLESQSPPPGAAGQVLGVIPQNFAVAAADGAAAVPASLSLPPPDGGDGAAAATSSSAAVSSLSYPETNLLLVLRQEIQAQVGTVRKELHEQHGLLRNELQAHVDSLRREFRDGAYVQGPLAELKELVGKTLQTLGQKEVETLGGTGARRSEYREGPVPKRAEPEREPAMDPRIITRGGGSPRNGGAGEVTRGVGSTRGGAREVAPDRDRRGRRIEERNYRGRRRHLEEAAPKGGRRDRAAGPLAYEYPNSSSYSGPARGGDHSNSLSEDDEGAGSSRSRRQFSPRSGPRDPDRQRFERSGGTSADNGMLSGCGVCSATNGMNLGADERRRYDSYGMTHTEKVLIPYDKYR